VIGAALVAGPAFGRVLGANERIHFGVIGTGRRGTSLLRDLVDRSRGKADVRVLAVCDVYEPRKERSKDICGGDLYHDYRDLLAREDLDAVIIAAPDHWHAQMTIDALNAGMHVYCEKPMTHTWEQAKEVAEMAGETGLVMQVGTQHTSEGQYWTARGLIFEGLLGKIAWVQAGCNRSSMGGERSYRIEQNASPDNLDWERWLGPAPEREFSKERYFHWRDYWDYSGGIATDRFYDKLAALMIALGPQFPIRVSAGGGICVRKDREVPDTFFMTIDYPGEYSVALSSSMANRRDVPDMIRGHEAAMYLHGDKVEVRPEKEFARKLERQHGTEVLRVPSKEVSGPVSNFINAVRGQEKCHCDAFFGYRAMTAIALGVASFKKNRMMHFDPAEQKEICKPVDAARRLNSV
jgi:predicted dehydrogenase